MLTVCTVFSLGFDFLTQCLQKSKPKKTTEQQRHRLLVDLLVDFRVDFLVDFLVDFRTEIRAKH